jgi:uncharacterized lipoprotein YddW (UPF0748 family)
MKILRVLLVLAITFTTLSFTKNDPNEKSTKKTIPTKKFSFAAWGDIGNKESIEEQKTRIKRLTDAGLTDLLPSAGVERLKELIKLGGEFGLKIHAWHWMMNVGGSKECQEHPEWFSVNRLGQNCKDFHPYVGYYKFLSPFAPGARAYIKRGVREKAQIKGLASVHFDYIRYVDVILGADLQKKYKHEGGELIQDKILPEYDFGYHPLARKEFEEKFGIDPLEMDDTAENPAWQQFRMNSISSLVDECVEICHEEGTTASAAVFPFPQLAREYVRQDWGRWNLDTFYPMIYKKDHQGNVHWVGFSTKEGVKELNPGQDLITGILVGHYGKNLADFEEAIVQAHDNGAKGIAFFTANSLTDAHLAIIKKYDEKYNK